MAKVLLIEDDRDLANNLKEWLSLENYLVELAEDGVSGLELLRTYEYDIIILDISLPRLSGLEVCRQYRQAGGSGRILMLTGRGSVADRADGLDTGADDYLTKPFHFKELSARLRAVMRRPVVAQENILRAGEIELDPRSFKVFKNGAPVHLARMEFALLEFLMRHPGQVFNQEALLERVWTADSERTSETIRSCIKKIRNKIDTAGRESLIQNVHGVGYKVDPG